MVHVLNLTCGVKVTQTNLHLAHQNGETSAHLPAAHLVTCVQPASQISSRPHVAFNPNVQVQPPHCRTRSSAIAAAVLCYSAAAASLVGVATRHHAHGPAVADRCLALCPRRCAFLVNHQLHCCTLRSRRPVVRCPQATATQPALPTGRP
jgi:hypothetical protein